MHTSATRPTGMAFRGRPREEREPVDESEGKEGAFDGACESFFCKQRPTEIQGGGIEKFQRAVLNLEGSESHLLYISQVQKINPNMLFFNRLGGTAKLQRKFQDGSDVFFLRRFTEPS